MILIISIPIDGTKLLITFTHYNHLHLVGSWGFARLSPPHTFNSN
ncbi:MAG: hypothetical protein QS721_14095 [Candidatus Endonucleobacter sp. (ex Gigantidas childressi)]|nr:hypothetical protein [Candidatus Endonucleobacter sp. (ex Gigantidas childressi)]